MEIVSLNKHNFFCNSSQQRVLFYLFFFSFFLGCAKPLIQPKSKIRQSPELSSIGMRMEDGYWLPIRKQKKIIAPQAVVISLHGFNDYSKAFDGMCKYFFSRIISVMRKGVPLSSNLCIMR